MSMWLAIFVVGALCGISVVIGAVSLAPWLPVFSRDVPRILNIAKLKPDDRFYDLGSGDGRLVRAIARNAGVFARGVEVALPLYLWSIFLQFVRPIPRVSFRLNNFFAVSLAEASVVYVFGRPGKLGARLMNKFAAELKPGTRVISYAFPLEGKEPVFVDKPTSRDISIYLYHF